MSESLLGRVGVDWGKAGQAGAGWGGHCLVQQAQPEACYQTIPFGTRAKSAIIHSCIFASSITNECSSE